MQLAWGLDYENTAPQFVQFESIYFYFARDHSIVEEQNHNTCLYKGSKHNNPILVNMPQLVGERFGLRVSLIYQILLYLRHHVCRRPKCNKVLNVITFCHKCNKVLNVITICQAANYSNYSNKPRPQIIAAFGAWGELISATALIRVNTVLSSITMVLSSALK